MYTKGLSRRNGGPALWEVAEGGTVKTDTGANGVTEIMVPKGATIEATLIALSRTSPDVRDV